jgi:hypothetical protein
LKPQALLDYVSGGAQHNKYDLPNVQLYSASETPAVTWGFERCIAVSYKNFKWLGQSGKVYRSVPSGRCWDRQDRTTLLDTAWLTAGIQMLLSSSLTTNRL